MANIIVAIICNVVAAFILLGCVLGTIRNGISVSLIKLVLTLGGGVAAFFATPAISTMILGVAVETVTLGTIINGLGISMATVNSVIFLLVFMVIYLINLIICSIIRHCKIKALQDKKQNQAKIKRARSINPRAEKAAKKSAWKALKAEYKARNKWWKRLISSIFGLVVGAVVSFVILMPYGYIAKDLVAVDENKAYLTSGFEYTLNGVIGEEISDFIVSAPEVEDETPADPEEPSEPEDSACEHSFVEGVCEHCGEAEAPVEPEIPGDVE